MFGLAASSVAKAKFHRNPTSPVGSIATSLILGVTPVELDVEAGGGAVVLAAGFHRSLAIVLFEEWIVATGATRDEDKATGEFTRQARPD